MDGYIYLHKKLLEWEWYHEPNTLRLFLHCLLKANYTDKMHKGILIKRGTFMTSSIKLASELDITRQQIRTAIANLKSTNEITINTTNKYSVINVVKYSEYQFKENKSTSKTPTTQPSNNHQITTTNKKNKEQLKELKEKDSVPYGKIIDYLNEKANTSFQPKAKSHKSHINARWNDGYRLDDFKKVIDVKVEEWLHDDYMHKYLRPSTLFGTKFLEYINQRKGSAKDEEHTRTPKEWEKRYRQPLNQKDGMKLMTKTTNATAAIGITVHKINPLKTLTV